MIGHLRGTLLEKNIPYMMLEVGGVGYELEASMNTFNRMPEIGQTTAVYTHLVVREDLFALYGFYDSAERELFRTLIKVNGVGPKSALSILSSISTDEFVYSIVNKDSARLTRLPGIGKKTAERLIIEMCDKLASWSTQASLDPASAASSVISNIGVHTQEVMSALLALGYKQQEANQAITLASKQGVSTPEELLRLALKSMA